MNDDLFRVALANLEPFDGCDLDFALALRAFRDSLTVQHSLTARQRNISIWALVKNTLDAPYRHLLDECENENVRLLLPPALSVIGRRSPKPDEYHGLDVANHNPNAIKLVPVEEIKKNLRLWDSAIRMAIRILRDDVCDSKNSRRNEELCASLDSIRSLIRCLSVFRPKSSINPEDKAERISDARGQPHSTIYCDLCWRETKRSALLKLQHVPYESGRRNNRSRYCAVHDPSGPKSEYRNDLRYKDAFQGELLAMLGICESKYELGFRLPAAADEQERRKAAYDLVHSRLRTSQQRLNGDAGLRERVWTLMREGKKQSDIARILGVHRQSVSRALKSLKALLKTRSNEECIDPSTGEPIAANTLSLRRGVVEEILQLRASGESIASIAQQKSLFKHTVKAVLRSLDE